MRKAIAIDFDGCLCEDAYPEIGAPHWGVILRALAEQEKGAGLILWTCREGDMLLEAIAACERWGLHFDAVNESLPEWIDAFGNDTRKVGATEYWDDRAVRCPEEGRPVELKKSESTSLKPCPFCGSKPEFVCVSSGSGGGKLNFSRTYNLWCPKCRCQQSERITVRFDYTPHTGLKIDETEMDMATAAWNRRAYEST